MWVDLLHILRGHEIGFHCLNSFLNFPILSNRFISLGTSAHIFLQRNLRISVSLETEWKEQKIHRADIVVLIYFLFPKVMFKVVFHKVISSLNWNISFIISGLKPLETITLSTAYFYKFKQLIKIWVFVVINHKQVFPIITKGWCYRLILVFKDLLQHIHINRQWLSCNLKNAFIRIWFFVTSMYDVSLVSAFNFRDAFWQISSVLVIFYFIIKNFA